MTTAPRNRPRRTTQVNTRHVPVSVRDGFKAYCAARGYTMQDAIIALMKKAAAEDIVLPDARRSR